MNCANIFPEFQPVDFQNVTIDDSFWAPRVDNIKNNTIPHIYQFLEKTGRLNALNLQWDPSQPEPHIFWESDVFKWLEAASYALAHYEDSNLRALVDETAELIAGAQQPDGYLNVYFTSVHPERRWMDLEGAHELYCAGHLFEAAVAHHKVTGSTKLLYVAKGYADYIRRVFGTGKEQVPGYPGHEEIELALIKLYRVTGEVRYLELAKYFVDQRGTEPNYFEQERVDREFGGFLDHIADVMGNRKEYNQSHKPVRDQSTIGGHAVRAMYLFSAVADLFVETGDKSLLEACNRVWTNMTEKRMYITGGIGSSANNEGFTVDYDLPNETAYAETCAAIGSVFWNHRLLQIQCDGRYADLLERTLYNAVLASVSQSGTKFFYANPMRSMGEEHRRDWYDVSCCPPNLARLMMSLGQYIYSYSNDEIAVHLFIQSSATVPLNGGEVGLRQESALPWSGEVKLTISVPAPVRFGVRIRIPEWASALQIAVNGTALEYVIENGYAVVTREWSNENTITVTFAIPIKRVYSNPAVVVNCGRVALQRGPLVYCVEEADNGPGLDLGKLPAAAALNDEWRPDLFGGCFVLKATARKDLSSHYLYQDHPYPQEECQLVAIPYYLWDNRSSGEMQVWIREA